MSRRRRFDALPLLVLDGVVAGNPVAAVPLPKGFEVERRPRVMLRDDEFARFMASPEVPEQLQLMALVSRCFGGMRTSDLHAWAWSHVDADAWLSAEVYRPKTDDADDEAAPLMRIEVPAEVRARLEGWWTHNKKPTGGPVFPIRAGKRQGSARASGATCASSARRSGGPAFTASPTAGSTLPASSPRPRRS